MQIVNPKNIAQQLKNEGQNLCVVSYGGCGTYSLVKMLEANGYIIRTHTWERVMCHHAEFVKLHCPVIYVYRKDIKCAYLSQLKKVSMIGQLRKMKNDMSLKDFDAKFFLQTMVDSLKNWTGRQNVLVLETSELFKYSGKAKIENFLAGRNIAGLPLRYEKVPKEHKTYNNQTFQIFQDQIDNLMK